MPTYDSLFFLDYDNKEHYCFEKNKLPLGVTIDLPFPYSSEPKVLEYKYDLDALINDFTKEIKFAKHIDFVVCWRASKTFTEKYYLNSLLVGDEGSVRQIFGSTHQAIPEGGGNQVQFEVLILEDFINFLRDPITEEARQKQIYDV